MHDQLHSHATDVRGVGWAVVEPSGQIWIPERVYVRPETPETGFVGNVALRYDASARLVMPRCDRH